MPDRERYLRDDRAAARRAASYRGSWGGPDDPDSPEEAASMLAGAIDYAFNPADGDSSQEALLIEPVLAAMRFIEDQPCSCSLQDDACGRCAALGRHHDRRWDR